MGVKVAGAAFACPVLACVAWAHRQGVLWAPPVRRAPRAEDAEGGSRGGAGGAGPDEAASRGAGEDTDAAGSGGLGARCAWLRVEGLDEQCRLEGCSRSGGGRAELQLLETTPGACVGAAAARPSGLQLLRFTVRAAGSDRGETVETLRRVQAGAVQELAVRSLQRPERIQCSDPSGCGRSAGCTSAGRTPCGISGPACADLCRKAVYIPPRGSAAGQRAAAGVPVADPDADEVQGYLSARQRPQKCSVARSRRWEDFNQGLGYLLTVAAQRLAGLGAAGSSSSSSSGGVFMFDAGPGVARRTESTAQHWGPRCVTPLGQQGGLSCHLRPASWCEVSLASESGRIVHLHTKLGLGGGGAARHRVRQAAAWLSFVPERWQHRGALWYHAQAALRLWRPHGATAAAVAEAQRLLGWTLRTGTATFVQPTVAVHLRRGDACHSAGRRCYPLSEYAAALLQLRDQYGVNRAFVATDSAALNAAQWCRDHVGGMVCAALPWDRTGYQPPPNATGHREQWINHRLMRGELDGLRLARQWVTDVEMMGRCTFFVGTLSSSASHFAFSILTARLRYVPPYISVDGKAWARVAPGSPPIAAMW
eukprot:TRINITY_DN20128_c0_g1_i4.p1 TRINITY_DN20128_c0_g1~~TRINITY_DN20128_c0_g1_i4.p1  ORF type:complete len:617 (+),score=114.16 TRINITY_DN20128_c0_g1_i4:70-1851(+)